MKRVLMAAMATGVAIAGFSHELPQLGKSSVDEVIDAMTLEEKVRLLIGNGMKEFDEVSGAVVGETADLVPGAAGTTYAIPRLGIPSIVLADGPAGLRINPEREGADRTFYATHFPIGTLLASTWNPALVEEVGKAIGNEVLEYGVDVLLAPGMNIQRNPLNGRNFEYYSEDPLLSGKIAAAYVRGVQSNNVGTSIKHYVANNQETNRTANDARVSQRALRQIYLKGFHIAVDESNPWTVMSSYNKLNGTYTAENKELLTTVLRDEWGYDGMVMSDWFGGKDAPDMVVAGNDMLQPGTKRQYDDILKAANDGSLDIKYIDRNVRRILELILKTPKFRGYRFSNNPDLQKHAEITRKSACEGMILLKNDNNALPLASNVNNIALFGNTSYQFIPGGTGSGNVNGAYTVSLLEGLRNAGYVIDENLKEIYDKHIAEEKIRLAPDPDDQFASWLAPKLPEEISFGKEELMAMAAANDAAIITIGRNSGEFADRLSSDFYLSENNKILIENVADAFHAAGKPVIVIMNIGGAIETASWKDKPDAILLAWQGGQEGGNSVTDILRGEVNPSGKLTMTFPLKVTDPYSSLNCPMDKGADMQSFFDMERKSGTEKDVDYTNYEEDVYVGYRYFDTFHIPVSYPFGFGMSYTSFEYGEPYLSMEGDDYLVSVSVKNVGNMSGKEVVQLYSTMPNSREYNEPVIVLQAFAKTKELQPGEEEIVKLRFKGEDLAIFDEEKSAWVTVAGKYELKVGASSETIKGVVTADVPAAVREVGNVFKPESELNLLRRE